MYFSSIHFNTILHEGEEVTQVLTIPSLEVSGVLDLFVVVFLELTCIEEYVPQCIPAV